MCAEPLEINRTSAIRHTSGNKLKFMAPFRMKTGEFSLSITQSRDYTWWLGVRSGDSVSAVHRILSPFMTDGESELLHWKTNNDEAFILMNWRCCRFVVSVIIPVWFVGQMRYIAVEQRWPTTHVTNSSTHAQIRMMTNRKRHDTNHSIGRCDQCKLLVVHRRIFNTNPNSCIMQRVTIMSYRGRDTEQ